MSLTDGLTAFWKFDGDLLDSQGAHDGTGSAELVFRPGVNGLAAAPIDLNVDGSAASMEIDPIILGGEWTIAIRIVPRENWDGQHKLFQEFATSKGLYLDDNSGNRGLGFWDGTNDWLVPGALGWPAIHHVAARFTSDGNELTLFANGVPVLSEAAGDASSLTVDRVAFDGYGWSLLLADNAAIYTRALTDEEVEELATWAGPGSGGADPTPPAAVIVSPVEGAAVTPNTALVVRVTDATGNLLRVMIVARFPNGDEELVGVASPEGFRYTARYSGSSLSGVTGGADFSVVRTGGWQQAPTLDVYAVDEAGNLES